LTWAQLVNSTFFLELPNWPVWLKSCHQVILPTRNPRDQYLSAEGGGGREVRADREIPALWETFTLIRLTQRDDNWLQPGDMVCLQAANGQYLTAEGGGGREVIANRARPSEWETFIIEEVNATGTPAPLPPGQKIQDGDSITLRTQDNKYYMTAERGPNEGGGAVNMNRTQAGDWERFIIKFPESSPGP
jgi:hypothetical protein